MPPFAASHRKNFKCSSPLLQVLIKMNLPDRKQQMSSPLVAAGKVCKAVCERFNVKS
jgi:hypothetical protein